jgi:hypothetical protein
MCLAVGWGCPHVQVLGLFLHRTCGSQTAAEACRVEARNGLKYMSVMQRRLNQMLLSQMLACCAFKGQLLAGRASIEAAAAAAWAATVLLLQDWPVHSSSCMR